MSQITISHLTFGYDGSAENVFDDLTLTLDTDWRLGLIGRNGRGKTTLTRIRRDADGKYHHVSVERRFLSE